VEGVLLVADDDVRAAALSLRRADQPEQCAADLEDVAGVVA
jgi:hypothetical protein